MGRSSEEQRIPAGRREKGVEANPSEELVTTLWAKLTEWRGVLSKEKSRSTVKPVSPSSQSASLPACPAYRERRFGVAITIYTRLYVAKRSSGPANCG
ncbi:hypothetical protein WN51_02548 [Melipona quadrifasciata]|uniref:Uncharacterized protein n=1 Tax=Melipona quadrifasciata TaxID=166423 RepID=A0A0N0BDI1_9HYME|nr:hypothetical protein WN51_02548 [Melipona quadrifasciata]